MYPELHCAGVRVRLKDGGAEPSERLLASYELTVLTRGSPGETVEQVCRHIRGQSGTRSCGLVSGVRFKAQPLEVMRSPSLGLGQKINFRSRGA